MTDWMTIATLGMSGVAMFLNAATFHMNGYRVISAITALGGVAMLATIFAFV